MSVTHSLQKFLRVQYNANKQNALGAFMSDYQQAWNTLYNEAKHLTYDPPYVLAWQIQFAPILTNLVHMNVDDISTGHHAKIVSAGNDSELAKKAYRTTRQIGSNRTHPQPTRFYTFVGHKQNNKIPKTSTPRRTFCLKRSLTNPDVGIYVALEDQWIDECSSEHKEELIAFWQKRLYLSRERTLATLRNLSLIHI